MNISGATTVIGIFGYPVGHSLSPIMHNAAFAALDLDYAYVPFAVQPAQIKEAVNAIRVLGLRGVNVTIPHKERVLEYLDEVAPEAELIGAVNTIVNEKGVLKGYNTDGKGFVRSLREKGLLKKTNSFYLIGAGGAARAVAVQLALEEVYGITLLVRQEDLSSAHDIAAGVNLNTKTKATVTTLEKFLYDADWRRGVTIVNCTPLGMCPRIDSMPSIDLGLLPQESVVCDLVYNPGETLFLRKAASLGLTTVSGLGMLLHQGAAAFELWTGRPAPVEVMSTALLESLS